MSNKIMFCYVLFCSDIRILDKNLHSKTFDEDKQVCLVSQKPFIPTISSFQPNIRFVCCQIGGLVIAKIIIIPLPLLPRSTGER